MRGMVVFLRALALPRTLYPRSASGRHKDDISVVQYSRLNGV